MPAAGIAFGYQVASRLAYVLYVGLTLKREEHSRSLTERYGAAAAFRRFRRTASVVMGNDGVSLIVLCLVTRNSLDLPLSPAWRIAVGLVLVCIGLGTKLWAAATLGVDGYYWRNFFQSGNGIVPTAAGPYRFLKNPMYTVGYLHTYGFALVTASGLGLLAALFDQIAILAFYWSVEKPHFDRHT